MLRNDRLVMTGGSVSELNFGDLLDAVGEVAADRTAIVYGDQSYSWRAFSERSNRLARSLIAMGFRPGDKVAFYLRNSPAYVELLAACFKARLVHVNVNYRYVDNELFYIFDNSDAALVVFDPEFRAQVDALMPRLTKVRAFMQTKTLTDNGSAYSFEQACAQGDGSSLQIQRSGEDLYFMYTGGTTGYPKAVMWPQNNRIEVIGMTAATSAREHARNVADAGVWPVVLPACPLMHSTGFTTSVSVLCNGGCVVMLPSARFDARECLREIDRCGVTSVALVGDAFSVPILEVLRGEAAAYDLSRVQTLTSAGAMWSANNKIELLEYFPNAVLRDSLGASEGSRLGSSEMRAGGSGRTGRFTAGANTKVLTEDHRELEPGSGEAGLIATTGPIPLGYYKDEERNRKTFPIIDGVRHAIPGDWCTLEADGTINLLGRGSGCINTGGEKVFPEEVEEALKVHPEVLDAAVFGVADERWGEAVAGVIRVRTSAAADEEAIRMDLRTRLAAYKCPKQLVVVEGSFRAENGKMDYAAAKRLYGV